MPKYVLEDVTVPVRLKLYKEPNGSVALAAEGGPGNDHQVLLILTPEGTVDRPPLNIAAARRLGLQLSGVFVWDEVSDGPADTLELLRDVEG